MKDYHAFVDWETRSLADLLKIGAWKYAADPSTYPLMLAANLPVSGRRLQWLHYKHGEDCPDWLLELIEDPEVTFHAHNANFEIAIHRRVCVERWGWPDIPTSRWCDTAGKASHANLPRSLDMVSKYLKVKTKKDKRGKELIKLLSIPQKALKTYKKNGEILTNSVKYLTENGIKLFELDPDDGPIWYWNNNSKALAAFAKYNEGDVITEHEVDQKLPDYTGQEAEMWALDSVINERGLPVDRELCESAQRLFGFVYNDCELLCAELTKGKITNPNSRAVVGWVNERVDFGPSLAADIIERWMERNPNPVDEEAREVRDMFNIKDLYGGSAIKKYDAALRVIEDDDRARGQFYFYGASTGRWAGKGIQPHNFYRQAIPDESVFDLLKSGRYDDIRNYATENNVTVAELVRSCVRGIIQAPEGKELIVSDFAGIESRVLQWLVWNKKALDIFATGEDMYVHTAADMYQFDYLMMMDEESGKVLPEFKEHRQIGKAAVLGLGYQMGPGRFLNELRGNGIDADQEFAADIVSKWRKANPLIADWERGIWRRLEKACKKAIQSRGKNNFVGRVKAYGNDNIALRVRYEYGGMTIELPSGRKLFYPEAYIDEGNFGPTIFYRDGGKNVVDTYGGKLVENVVQAISRDLLVNSLFLAERRGLMVIGHVHDEIIVEHELEGIEIAYEELHECMQTVPEWAAGLPLAAETYRQRRYTK